MTDTKAPKTPEQLAIESGPAYLVAMGATVAKLRSKAARNGLAALSHKDRQAYGAAVEKAILAKQRTEFMAQNSETVHRPNCASGTWYTTGADIDKAIKSRQRAALAACPSQERRAREPQVWARMYEEAMEAKRAALATPPQPPKGKAGPKTGKIAAVIVTLKNDWTPAADILASTGWVSNTFRGILGAHKKATGERFERKRIAGVTHYRIAA